MFRLAASITQHPHRYFWLVAMAISLFSPSVLAQQVPEVPIQVQMMETSPDLTAHKADDPPATLSFSIGTASPSDEVQINDNMGYQQFVGFGANLSDLTLSMWKNLSNSTNPTVAAQAPVLMNTIFDKTGMNLSLALTAIGADDQVADICYNNPADLLSLPSRCRNADEGYGYQGTYDDLVPPSTDPTLASFNLSNTTSTTRPNGDFNYIIPGIKQAMMVKPNLRMIASAYWMPNWGMAPDLKSDGVTSAACGNAYGTSSTTGVETFAPLTTAVNYFALYLNDYLTEGIPIWALIPQNEPCIPGAQQAGNLNPVRATQLIDALATKLAGLTPRIYTQLLPEVNDWGAPAGYTYPLDYVNTLYSDIHVPNEILGVAWHPYGGTGAAPTQGTHHAVTQNSTTYQVDQYNTEYDRSQSGALNTTPSNFHDAANQAIIAMQYWSKSWMWHGIANDPGIDMGACNTTCMPMITVDPTTGAIGKLQPYYIMKQLATYIQPGAYVVNTNIFQTHTTSGAIYAVVVRNPDGSHVLVAINYDTVTPHTLNIQWGAQLATPTIYPGSMATFYWSGIGNATYTEKDNASSSISYGGSGWHPSTTCGSSCYGSGTITYDSTAGDTAATTFSGSSVNLYGARNSSYGTAKVYVDTQLVGTIDEGTGTAVTGNALVYTTPQFLPGTHNLQIVVGSGGKPFYLDNIEAITPPQTSIDDAQFTYAPAADWSHCTACDLSQLGMYNGSYSHSDASGSTAKVTFTGKGITLFTVNGPSSGYASIQIDAGTSNATLPVTVDTYYAPPAAGMPTSLGNQIAYVSPLLASATHTLTVTVLGTHNALSTDSQIHIDRVEIAN